MVRDYIIIATSSFVIGVVIALAIVSVAVRTGLNLGENLWILAVPAILAIILNIILIEIYRKWKGRK